MLYALAITGTITLGMSAISPTSENCSNSLRLADFPIVGIGASAGGLDALQKLLGALPGDTGMGFVIVQHLAPDHPSSLAEILTRATVMPVCQVRDEPVVEPNQVYVIPPGRDMIIRDGKLRLLSQERHTRHRGIDQFFRSLAEDNRHQAIGVVLSGSASDGTLGLEAIKSEGGVTFAQNESAQHDSMPKSAVASGCVDYVLPPEEIALEIARIARHPYVALPPDEDGRDKEMVGHARIAEIVWHATGADFTHYKGATMRRRIERRMMVHKIETLAGYEEYLREMPGEVEALYQDLLINVTSFFRDPEAYETLKKRIFPKLLADRSPEVPVRMWTVGCSTGEEAYSLAMVFAECAEAAKSTARLQLFASDVNAIVIEKARLGRYSLSIAHDVSPERLRKFFVEEDGHYCVNKNIRECVVFARHNVLADAPFSRVEFISCRNLLIYHEPVLQEQVLRLLHYALKPGGHLWLGSAESPGTSGELFEVVDARQKIFVRQPGTFPTGDNNWGARSTVVFPVAKPIPRESPQAMLHRDAERLLLAKYAPPGVVVNARLEVVQFRGETGAYLAPAAGLASHDLFKMLREGLLMPVRNGLARAESQGGAVREEGAWVKNDGGLRELAIEVIPVEARPGREAGFVVLFDESSKPPAEEIPHPKSSPSSKDDELPRLRQELAATRAYLQSVIEQLEAANQELQSANEEAQLAHEEMQTSKEEIQSSSEELLTINAELNNRNVELNALNSDLHNVLTSTHLSILLFTRDLCIRRFTSAAQNTLQISGSDLGRPLGDIRLSMALPELGPLLLEVIDQNSPRERDVQDAEGRWFSLRARPYLKHGSKVDGAVAMLVDVDELRRARIYAEDLLAHTPVPVLVLDPALRVITASRAFYQAYRVAPPGTVGRTIYEMSNGQWNIPALRTLLEEVLPHEKVIADFELHHTFIEIGPRVMRLNAKRLDQAAENEPRLVLSIEDITEQRQTEVALRSSELRLLARADQLTQANRRKDEFLAMLAHELRNPLAPLRNAAELLQGDNVSDEERTQAQRVIGRQIENMSRMLEDLLDVSRINAGRIKLRKKPVPLVGILTSAVSLVRASCAAHRQELTVSLPTEPIYLDADATRLEQVFGNLLGNACKYSGDGCHISLSAERLLDAEPPEALIKVRDNGAGIDQELLPQIFDLFVQASRTLDRSHGGLGIGLTLVQRIVQLHGGTVEAHSEGQGHGAEFVVRLPILTQAPPPEPLPSGPPVSSSPCVSRRILIVDDNTDSARTLATLQERRGHQTRTAFTGPEAVTTAVEFVPDVVLLDIGLPGMDGYEVARKIRAIPALAGTFLIAMTGYGRNEDRAEAKLAGFDEYMVKPVDLDTLRDWLHKSRP